jgi:hypothetical protein
MRFLRQIRELIRLTQTPRDHKQTVFYCEGPNYFPHLQGLLQETLELVDQPCCYISSNRDDPGLGIDHPKLKQFETDEGHLRNWLFANLEADLVILTMPDLEQYQLKRSPKVAHYAYVQHSLVST